MIDNVDEWWWWPHQKKKIILQFSHHNNLVNNHRLFSTRGLLIRHQLLSRTRVPHALAGFVVWLIMKALSRKSRWRLRHVIYFCVVGPHTMMVTFNLFPCPFQPPCHTAFCFVKVEITKIAFTRIILCVPTFVQWISLFILFLF